MKKFIYLLVLLLPALALTSCHDDDDLPNVSFDINFENAVEADGQLYVVLGDNLEVTSVGVINNEPNSAAVITSATYYWDGYYIGFNDRQPYGYELTIGEDVPLGRHELAIQCPIYAVDKSMAIGTVYFTINVVESESDIPATGSNHYTVTPDISASGK